MEFIQLIEQRKVFLEEEISHNKKIKNTPPGELILQKSEGKTRFFQVTKENGIRKKRYLSKKDDALINTLIRKRVSRIQLKRDLSELHFIQLMLNSYHRHISIRDQQFLQNPEVQRRLLQSSRISLPARSHTTLQQIRNWQNEPYVKDTSYPEGLHLDAGQGLFVRSKSEVQIVACLRKYKIPFRYEAQIKIYADGDTQSIYPDFTILHPYTGQIYYLEHFGLFDSSEYQKKIQWKMQYYPQNGIYPYNNLILLYETRSQPLSMAEIERLIRFYFIDNYQMPQCWVRDSTPVRDNC